MTHTSTPHGTRASLALAGFLVTAAALPLQAATINEADFGDFGADTAGQQVFELQEGLTTISGSLAGSCSVGFLDPNTLGCLSFSGDFSDRFAVSVSEQLSLDGIEFSFAGANSIGDPAVFAVPGIPSGFSQTFGGFIGPIPLPISGQSLDLGLTWTDLTGSDLVEGFADAQASYSFSFLVSAIPISDVPLPAGFPLLALGLMGLHALRRRKS